jgi:enamine deaminase RidA (YjgF/YER057c/UK114 family)
MISRFAGLTPTRSRAIVYITDIKRKSEMNRAWDEWVDPKNPPMRACIGVELEPPHIVEIVVTAAK